MAGNKSTIKTLPKEILDEVNELLTEDSATIDEIVAHLEYLRHPRSRSAVGRYKQQVDKVAEKLRRSREMANTLVREIGPGVVEGKTGRLLVEILQSIAFDFLLKRAGGEPGEPGEDGEAAQELDSQDFFFLGKALKEMASALKIDTDRELTIRKEVAKELTAKLSEAVDEAEKAGEPGLSKERVAQLTKDFLGVRPSA